MPDRTTLSQLILQAKDTGRGLVLNARNQHISRIEKSSGLIYEPTNWMGRMAVGRSGAAPRTTVSPTVNYDVLTRNYFRNSVYILANAVADRAAAIGYKVNRVRDGKSGPIRQHVSISHPLYGLLQEPYPGGTFFDLIYELSLWLQLCGDAYARKHKNAFGIPDRLEPLSPQWVKIIPGEESFIEGYNINTLYLGTASYEIKRGDMIHVQRKNPDKASSRRFYGLSTCIAMENTIRLEEEMWSRLSHKMTNYARPGMVFATEKRLNEIQMNQQINAIMSQHRLAEQEGRPMLLHDGTTLVAGGDNAHTQELDFRGSLEDTLKITGGGFGVSPSIAGMQLDVTKANAEASQYGFAINKLNPHLTQMSLTLTNHLAFDFEPEDRNLEIQIGPFDIKDYREIVNACTAVLRSGGVLTSNEARNELFGLPPLDDGGDNVMLPAGVTEGAGGNASMSGRM